MAESLLLNGLSRFGGGGGLQAGSVLLVELAVLGAVTRSNPYVVS